MTFYFFEIYDKSMSSFRNYFYHPLVKKYFNVKNTDFFLSTDNPATL